MHERHTLEEMGDTALSREAYERLQAELDDLTTRGRVEMAQASEASLALGDLSENGDYHAAKDSQGKMEARIRQLQTMLVTARVIDRQAGGDVVEAGSVVAIRYAGDDATERYLVGSIEERRDGLEVISPASPLGQALLGRRAGERVTYEAVGRTLDVEIVTVGD